MAFLILLIAFVACTAVLLFYHLYFHNRLVFHKQTDTGRFKQPVSVIVVANNEFENLQTLIPALLAQQYPDFEVILVDDRSYDETYDYFLDFTKSHPTFRFLRVEETPETSGAKKFALTLAIKAAHHDHLLFIDADCQPASDFWLQYMSNGFENKKDIVIGVSPYYPQNTFLNSLIQFETGFTALQYSSFALAGIPYMSVGRNWGYRKQLFLDTKGFHPHNKVKGGDDDLFLQKIATSGNTSVRLNPDAFTYSKAEQSWGDWVNQKVRHYSVSSFYTGKIKFILGLFHAAHLLSYILFIVLLFSQEFRLYSSTLFMVRVLLFWFQATRSFKLLTTRVKWHLIPVFEFVHSLLIVTFGLMGLRAKKIKWK